MQLLTLQLPKIQMLTLLLRTMWLLLTLLVLTLQVQVQLSMWLWTQLPRLLPPLRVLWAPLFLTALLLRLLQLLLLLRRHFLGEVPLSAQLQHRRRFLAVTLPPGRHHRSVLRLLPTSMLVRHPLPLTLCRRQNQSPNQTAAALLPQTSLRCPMRGMCRRPHQHLQLRLLFSGVAPLPPLPVLLPPLLRSLGGPLLLTTTPARRTAPTPTRTLTRTPPTTPMLMQAPMQPAAARQLWTSPRHLHPEV